ncbi:CGNR zinc finger domain-containing protein [Ruania alba]|uniref:CGNR zinc finger domain-containing protein n=1 Tax=Ruania alba TaxID=648782 RepID=A0A1H5D2F2_9MICO|nr:CGNR zinc finger domain-containing protein [Ruania alba]SED73107.1 CGNR zinc finger domain-containing protein [Ruania alba]
MHLNPYGEYAVLLAASLANDWPADRAGIEERTREFGMTQPFPEAPGDHAGTRRVIDGWLTVVDAPGEQERAGLLNAQMAAVTAYPRLTDHDDEGWHLHYRDDGHSLPHVLAAVISVGTALHLTTRGMHRLARCAAGQEPGDPCSAVVVDVTRNGRQRYCSVRCANRAAVRRHRARRV